MYSCTKYVGILETEINILNFQEEKMNLLKNVYNLCPIFVKNISKKVYSKYKISLWGNTEFLKCYKFLQVI